jgi:hypothetical protein
MRYRGVYGGKSVSIDVDQDDMDVITDFHDEYAGESDEEIARRCIAYLCSEERRLSYARRQH